MPNTVGKLYESPDGETDTGRLSLYSSAEKANLERHGALMTLPWRFDKDRWAFIINDANLSPADESVVAKALQRVGNVYEVHSLNDYSYRAGGPKAQVEKFRSQLAATVPEDIYVGDLGDLPWKKEYNGITVAKSAFIRSGFYKTVKGESPFFDHSIINIQPSNSQKAVSLSVSYDRNVMIARDDVNTLALYVAVERALEKRYERFFSEHGAEIKALPWSFEITDKIDGYNAISIYKDNLTEPQLELIDELVKMNQLEEHHDNFSTRASLIRNFLKEQFEQSKPATIAAVAELPWKHSSGGMTLLIPNAQLNREQLKLLKSAGVRPDGWGNHSIKATEGYEGDGQNHGESMNNLRRSVSQKIRERTNVAEITPEIAAMPWQYGGRLHGRAIVLDSKNISEKQKTDLQTAIPEIHYMGLPLFGRDNFDVDHSGYFALTPSGDDDIAHAVIDAPYYAALKHVAERSLDRLVKDAATFPWRKNEAGGFELKNHELTRGQQRILQQIPADFFDREAEWAERSESNLTTPYVIDPKSDDQRLMSAIKFKSVGLPDH